MRVNSLVIDLQAMANEDRISLLLFGESFTVERTEGAFSYGRTSCAYQGWVLSAAMAPMVARVIAEGGGEVTAIRRV